MNETKGDSIKAIGYCRVSTLEQGDSGLGLESQRAAIEQECERRGWALLRIEEDVASGKKRNGRPGLARALEACESREANCLIAAKLDRITRSLLSFAELVEEAKTGGYDLVVIDQSFDLGTPHGKAMAGMLAVFAEYERELIGQRTSQALQAKKAQGFKLGRPRTMDEGTRKRILRERRKGLSYRAIAEGLNRDKVPTAQGGSKWHAATVRKASL
jgi:DNA invertase Pin-like site-specific DNA recombinase